MSAPRYRIPPKVIALLHDRGMTVERLAALAGTGRAHATQVLANKPGRGGHTRHKLADHLLAAELEALGWDAIGRRLSENPVPVLKRYDSVFGSVTYVKNSFHAERSTFPRETNQPQPLTR